MKKPLAITLLIIGSVVAWFAVLFGSALLGAASDQGGVVGFITSPIVFPIMIALAATFGVDCLRKLFLEKYGLKAPLFYLCAYAPVALWVAVSLPGIIKHFGSDYGGVSYYYEQEFVPAVTATILGGALLWLTVSTVVKRLRAAKE